MIAVDACHDRTLLYMYLVVQSHMCIYTTMSGLDTTIKVILTFKLFYSVHVDKFRISEIITVYHD